MGMWNLIRVCVAFVIASFLAIFLFGVGSCLLSGQLSGPIFSKCAGVGNAHSGVNVGHTTPRWRPSRVTRSSGHLCPTQTWSVDRGALGMRYSYTQMRWPN